MSDQGGDPAREVPEGIGAVADGDTATHASDPVTGATVTTPADGERAAIPPPPPPPPPAPPAPGTAAPIALTPVEPGRRRSWRPLVAVAAAVVVAAGAIAVVATRGGDEPSADEALERAQAALEDVDSFRMHSVSEDRSTTGEEGGAGSSTIYRTITDTDVAEEASHTTYDDGEWADEVVMLADGTYMRSADSVEALPTEPWELYPNDASAAVPVGDDPRAQFLSFVGLDYDGDGEVDPDVVVDEYTESMVVPGLAAYYLFGSGAPVDAAGGLAAGDLPAGLAETFGSFEDAEVVADDGEALVIAATRTVPPELAEGVDIELPPGRFEITLGADDLPTRLALTVDGTNAHYVETVDFTDWGADIAIGVPEGEVDETPWLDEEALAEVRGTVEALAPTVVPDGLVLSSIDALPADEAEEFGNEPCGQLMLSYMPPTTDAEELDDWFMAGDYLDVYLLPQSCALAFDDTPFEPGEFGLPSREVDYFVEVLVGETVVQFDTTYLDDVPTMVTSIQPFDLDAEVARVGALAEEGLYSEL
jgi:hypothetical protein